MNRKDLEDIRLKKEHEQKNRAELDFFNLLINLIIEHAYLRCQLFNKREKEARDKSLEIESPKKIQLEKNINHVLALLTSAHVSIRKDGPTLFTDYLIISALSLIAKHLPEKSVREIIKKLNDEENHQSTDSNKQSNTDKIFKDLISVVRPVLFTSDEDNSRKSQSKQIVIDFSADRRDYEEYGIKRAKRLYANLFQTRPDQFCAVYEKFSITENTTLTLIGHCHKGSDYLSDNSGRRIYASELAKQIHAKMMQTGVPPNTAFTIDLIACQAASAHGLHPSFAQRLVKELYSLGINNVNVLASPTIMVTTHDGGQANLSWQQDQKVSASASERDQQTNGIFNNLFSIFADKQEERFNEKLNVEKVTFRSDAGFGSRF